MFELTDVHCHFVPKVDDGASTMKEAIRLLSIEYKGGVRRVILTPHYRRSMFETSQSIIEEQFNELKQRAKMIIGKDLELYLGCEFHTSSSMVEELVAKRKPTLAGSSYVLVEFSSSSSYSKIRDQILKLLSYDYMPIIAHIERYECLVKNIDYVEELIEAGAFIQVNAGSILGEDGWKIKRYCKLLMNADYVHFVGSDAHDLKNRKPNLTKCAHYVEKKMGHEYAQHIFVTNPDKIFESAQGDSHE